MIDILEEKLFKEVKENELKVTWNEEDSRIKNIIEDGKSNLEDLTGTKLDFTKSGRARSLLLSYCRYSYNSALEYFEDNFHKEITRLQYAEAIENARQEEQNESGKQEL